MLDRKRMLSFLESVDEIFRDLPASTLVNETAKIRGGRKSSGYTISPFVDCETEDLRRIYKEVLRRGGGRLIHRYERKIAELDCVCYQNVIMPRIGLVFLHGFDGSPYDFISVVRRFYDRLGARKPALWVLPAGPYRSLDFESADDLMEDIPRNPPEMKSKEEVRRSLYLSGADVARQYVTGQDDLNGENFDDINYLESAMIDQSGGYRWWDIPALDLMRGKTFKILVQALRQNLRTPDEFFYARDHVVALLKSITSIWNIPLSQIFVGGFSQGAMVASDILLAAPSAIAGAIVLSGAPIGRSDHRQTLREIKIMKTTAFEQTTQNTAGGQPQHVLTSSSRFNIPIFQAHGLKDSIVPFPVGKFLKKHLQSMGFNNLTFEKFPDAHEFKPELQEKVIDWLLTTTPFRAFRKGIGPTILGSKYFFDSHGENTHREDTVRSTDDSKIHHRLSRLKNKLLKRVHSKQQSDTPNRRESSFVSVISTSSANTYSPHELIDMTEIIRQMDAGKPLPKETISPYSNASSTPKTPSTTGGSLPQILLCEENGLEVGQMFRHVVATKPSYLTRPFDIGSPISTTSPNSAASPLSVETPSSLNSDDCCSASPLDENTVFDWSSFSVKLSRVIAEIFMRLNNYEGTRTVPFFDRDQELHRLEENFSTPNLAGGLRGDFDFPLLKKKEINASTMEAVQEKSELSASESAETSLSRHTTPVTVYDLGAWCAGYSSSSAQSDMVTPIPRNLDFKCGRVHEKLRHPRTWRKTKKKLDTSVPRLRALSIRNNKIVVAGEYGDIYVYDFHNDDLQWKLIYSTTLAAKVLRSAAIEPNLKAVYVGDSTGAIHKLDLDDYAIKTLPQSHEGGKSVSTIATFHPSSFISGGWDGTAIVWQNDQMKLKFSNYHTHAVCCCVIDEGLYMTSSQSGHVVLRREIQEPDALVTDIHSDIVRKIVKFRPYHAVSCSNDGKLGFWSILKPSSGTTRYVLRPIRVDQHLGYSIETETFIYDVDAATHEDKLYVVYTMEEAHMARLAIFRMEIVDDIVVHLFKEKQIDICSFTVTTWCIRIKNIVDENQLFKEFAILAASYNGIIRVFTTNPSIQMGQIEIAEARESLVAADKKAETNQDELVIERLPSIQDASDRKYHIKGKIQLFRDITGKNVLVYEWTGSEWNFIGNMTGNPEDQPVSPTAHDTNVPLPENDHSSVVDVKLSYKPGNTYKLKYNRGEDSETIARRFCEQENLELYHMFPIIKQLSEEPNPTTIICELESVSPVKCYLPYGWGKPTVEAAVKKILSTDLQQPPQIKRLSIQQRMVLEGAIGVLDSPNPKIAGPKSKEILATLSQFDWTAWQPANQQFAFYDLLRIALYYDEAADLYRKTSLSKGSLGVFNVLSELVKSESTAMRSCILKFLTNVCRWASLRTFFVEHASTIVGYLKSANLKEDTHSSVGPLILNIALAVQGNMAFAKTATQQTALLLKIRPFYAFLVDNVETGIMSWGLLIQAMGLLVDCFPELKGDGLNIPLDLTDKFLFEASRLVRRR